MKRNQPEKIEPVKQNKIPTQNFRQYLTKEELLGMIDRIHAKQKKEK
jgi:hypothetical protein